MSRGLQMSSVSGLALRTQIFLRRVSFSCPLVPMVYEILLSDPEYCPHPTVPTWSSWFTLPSHWEGLGKVVGLDMV